ncbi:MAG TPA: tetratricopeptide repeat protein [Pseudolabrys sp.]|nr:tetratricopeptide repeat protein [Pseudolabrys sp.]
MRFTCSVHRLFVSAAAVSVLALSVAGCKTTGDDITGSVAAAPAQPRSDADWRQALDMWGQRYHANNDDLEAATAYARALRATGQRAQAVAVLRQAALRHPENMPLLGAYGRALADAGDYQQALDVLGRAHTPDNPDWRILNAQGAVLDQMGRHAEAQRYYSSALKIVPNEPSVLSNLGLSYALEKQLTRAEATLRKAVAQPHARPKVRQNLALIVGLEGRFAEAEKIASADLPPAEAEANIAYLRNMLEQKSTFARNRGRNARAQAKVGS